MRGHGIAFTALLLGCVAQAEPRREGLAEGSIGPVRLGMSAAEIEALGRPTVRDEVLLEGDPYPRFQVEIADGQIVEVIFWEGRALDLTTTSPALATDSGARVGATLSELRRLYPEGEVNIGNEEGGYFNYEVGQGQFFLFDTAEVPPSCFEYNGACPDLGHHRATAYFLRALGSD